MKKNIVKFQVGDISTLALTVGITAIILSFVLLIQGNVRDEMTVDSAEYNASAKGIEATSEFADYLPLVAIVIVAVVLIGLLVSYFMRRI